MYALTGQCIHLRKVLVKVSTEYINFYDTSKCMGGGGE